MSEEKSKTIAYSNGEILDIDKVRIALFEYWSLNDAEKRSFDKTAINEELKQKYLEYKEVSNA